jgi:nitrite reductase/ring-hydroxylating ferredoxin subunit
MTEYELCDAADVAPGELKAFSADGRRVLVCNVDGEFHALDELCPHLAVPLGHGTLNGTELTCPGHGSVFDVAAGTCLRWIGRKPGLVARVLSSSPTTPAIHRIRVIDGVLVVDLP